MANRTRDTANLVSDNNLYVNITTDKVGIGTTTPTSKLTVQGDVLVSGVLTATNLVGTALSISGISTLGTVQISSGIITATTGSGDVVYYGDGSQLKFVTAESSAVAIATNTTNQSQFLTYVTQTGNVSGLGVTTTGLVFNPSTNSLGIGTITPTSKLTVQGDVLVSGVLTASSIVGTSLSISGISTIANFRMSPVGTGATVGGIGVTYYGDGSNLTGVSAFSVEQQNLTATPVYPTFASNIGVSSIGIAATQVAYIPSSGNLGIGTTTPLSKLDVRGDVSIASTLGIGTVIDIVPYDTLNSGTLSWEGSAGQLFSITNNLTTGSIYSVNDVSGIPSIDVDANGTIQLGPYGGNVGLGTTNPTAKLHVGGILKLDAGLRDINGTVGAAGSILTSTGVGVSWSSSTSSAASIPITNTTTDATHYVGFSPVSTGTTSTLNVTTNRLTFNPSSGTLSATVFTSLSDRTQKEDIRPIENSIEIVKQLTGVRYNWKDSTNQPSIGLIAQDVEEVIPEVVVEMADGLKSVSYGNIVAVLIEAIKEQQVRIEELEDKLNA